MGEAKVSLIHVNICASAKRSRGNLPGRCVGHSPTILRSISRS